MVRPLSRVVMVTPGGMEAMSPLDSGLLISVKVEGSRYSEMGGGQMEIGWGKEGEHRTLNVDHRRMEDRTNGLPKI